jgi:hypothetical protein
MAVATPIDKRVYLNSRPIMIGSARYISEDDAIAAPFTSWPFSSF